MVKRKEKALNNLWDDRLRLDRLITAKRQEIERYQRAQATIDRILEMAQEQESAIIDECYNRWLARIYTERDTHTIEER